MKTKKKTNLFDKFSRKVTEITGRPGAFLTAFAIIILWGVTGPIFNFSDTWQLIINTGTTIITFLMVFVIQQSQNRDTIAIQLKLNELISSSPLSSNRLIDIEDLTEEELQVLKKYYVSLAKLIAQEQNLSESHSYTEAVQNHARKKSAKSRTFRPRSSAATSKTSKTNTSKV